MEEKFKDIKEKIKKIVSKGEDPLKNEAFMVYLSRLNLTNEENEEVFELINSQSDKFNVEEIDESIMPKKNYFSRNNPLLNIYVNDIGKYRQLTEEEVKQLFIDYKNGDETAKEKLFNHNLKLVVYFVLNHRPLDNNAIMDLIQEGNMGLLRAIELFDYKRGHRFSTYARFWIKEKIFNYVYSYGQVIRTPIHKQLDYNKLKRVKDDLAKELSREPTREEVAKKMDISIKKLNDIEQHRLSIISLDYGYKNSEEDDENELLEIMVSNENVEDEVLNTDSKDNLKKLIEQSNLTAREKLVIEMKYLSSEDIVKDTTLAKHFGVQRERIRQVKSNALRKLKSQILNNNSNFEL